MSASVLREAAALMRERAVAATAGGPRWEAGPDEMHGPAHAIVYPDDSDSAVAFAGSDDAKHIASWHPAVALAVADWLDDEADNLMPDTYADQISLGMTPEDAQAMAEILHRPAIAVARAYLGRDA